MVSQGAEAGIAVGSIVGFCLLYVLVSKLADIFFPGDAPKHRKPESSSRLLAKTELQEVVIANNIERAKETAQKKRGKDQEFATDMGVFGGNEASQAYVGGSGGGYATTNIS
ncbi:hypothetical protein FBU59_006854 [Linderina macrospora]|uniref:Uncharacterized protein n=1 Tax=Linderina macrospora TaxID=4868 RepID=A0ACC1IYN6_9FUNG|nr:hypothetical protein FBU59_006854 [Linderina macrospora]